MKKIRIGKLNSVMPKKILRGVFWTFIVLIMVRGVAGFIKADKSAEVYDKIKNEVQLVKVNMNIESGANSFAENFAREFLSFKKGQAEEYRKRVSSYMTDQALTGVITSVSVDSIVIDSNAVTSTYISNGKYDIDVRVKMQSPTAIKDVYLRVPVTEVNKEYVVEEVPFLIARPKLANINDEKITGNAVEMNIQKEVESTLNNFLKVYTEGTEGEINYYLSDATKSVKGLSGTYKFRSIVTLEVYLTDEVDKYNTLITYSIEDSETKQEIKQKVKVSIVNKDKRYYIDEIATRTNN